MLFTIRCTFQPGALELARTNRPEHCAFMSQMKGTIVQGGPSFLLEGSSFRMLLVVDRRNAEEAREFISLEPYTAAGLFESIAVRLWTPEIPGSAGGFQDHEYQQDSSTH
ncbi:MAG: YciI family protein [Bryobacteraceae bacterium]